MIIPSPRGPPSFLRQLLTGRGNTSKHFCQNILAYIIQGNFHASQIPKLSPSLLQHLAAVLHDCNTYVPLFVALQNLVTPVDTPYPFRMVIHSDRRPPPQHVRHYNSPKPQKLQQSFREQKMLLLVDRIFSSVAEVSSTKMDRSALAHFCHSPLIRPAQLHPTYSLWYRSLAALAKTPNFFIYTKTKPNDDSLHALRLPPISTSTSIWHNTTGRPSFSAVRSLWAEEFSG